MSGLVLCVGCTRHVRASESSCPFCGAAVEVATRGAPRAVGPATSRAAILFLGAVAATGCGEPNKPGDPSSASPGNTPSQTPTFVAIPPYGVPPTEPTAPPEPPPPPPPSADGASKKDATGGPGASPSASANAKPSASPSAAPFTGPPPIRAVPPYGAPPIPPEKKKPK